MKLRAFVLAALAAAAGSLVFAAPARAAWEDCSLYPGTICIWEHGDLTGKVWRQYPSQIVDCRSLVPGGWNDIASGFQNNTRNAGNRTVRFYEHADCTGNYITLVAGEGQFYPSGSTVFNDRASAVRIL